MYVLVNAAMSADGKLSDADRGRVRLSSEEDLRRVHELRADADAVLVGVGTVLADDPRLTVRRVEGEDPLRVVADSRARTPTDASILGGEAGTVVGVGDGAPADRVDGLREAGAKVVETGGDRTDLRALVDALGERDVDRLLVEGGGEVIASVLSEGLADEVRVYVAPVFVGGRDSPTLVDGGGFVGDYVDAELDRVDRVGDGVVLVYVTGGR